MKKKLVVLMLAMSMAVTGAACSSDKENTKTEEGQEGSSESTSGEFRLTTVSSKDLEKYITLGEYKGISVENSIEEVTEDQIDAQVETAMQDAAEEVDDAAIEEGDIANIDYEGTLDGVAFDGGTAQGYDLNIGSGSFIDGFEDGLIGAKKGEERDLNLTFPEEYPSEELAGQSVVFHVKVNSIKRPVEITDEWVKENTGYEDIKAYRESIRTNMEENNKVNAQNNLKGTAWNQVFEACEVKEYPEEDIEKEKTAYNDLMEQYAKQYDTTVEEMLEAQGMTQEQYDEQCQSYAETMVKQNLIVQAIMDKEGLSFSGEEAETALNELLQDYGVETKEEMISQYGEQAVNESIGVIMAGNFVIDNAKVENVISTDDGKNGIDADAEEEAK